MTTDLQVMIATMVIYFIQAIANILALFLIYRQLRTSQEQAKAAMEQTKDIKTSINEAVSSRVVGYYYSMMEYLIQHKHVSSAFYRGDTEYLKLSSEDQDIYEFLGLAMSIWESVYLSHRDGRLDDASWRAWDNWFSQRVLTMSHFKNFWRKEASFYVEYFVHFVDAKLQKNME